MRLDASLRDVSPSRSRSTLRRMTMRIGTLASLLTFLSLALQDAGGRASDFQHAVGDYVRMHCLACHGEERQEGEFRIDQLSENVGFEDTSLWAEVRERISSGEMPPADFDPQPRADASAAVTQWLTDRIKLGEQQRMAARQRVSFYRLSRPEYVHTVDDLLGVHFDAADPGGFSEDPRWDGFDRIGAALSLSASHVEKYLEAAETILDEAYPDQSVEPIDFIKPAVPPNTVREPYRSRLEQQGLLDKVRYDLWPQDKHRYSKPGRLPAPGVYEVQIRLSGLQPAGGRPPRLKVYHSKLDRVLFEQDVVAAEDQPITVTFRMHLPEGPQDILVINDVPGPSNLPRSGRHGRKPFVSIADGRIPWQLKLTDEQGAALYPFLILDEARWTGPIVTDRQQALRARYMPEDPSDMAAVAEGIAEFAGAAFRRPLRDGELDRYLAVIRDELDAGSPPRDAVKTGMLAVLCSNAFLYIVEGSEDENRQRLDDWELASRLSYFLWSTMPDEELFSLAAAGKLHQKEHLREQLQRMLADPRADRFCQSFATGWLQLHKVGMFPPDEKLYPEYDAHLQQSMIGESVAYFREVLLGDGTLRDFLDSDWTMANSRLASFYGIDGVDSDSFRRVALQPEHRRGGLLTQASVLSLTSDGTRHRPVHRGVWVSENILGKSPPPPPANVDPIEPNPTDAPKATLRQKLAAHMQHDTCASCHQKIDPLGLAFENYDAIGRWRTEEVVAQGQGKNPSVDASGRLPDGREFADAEAFKQLLMEDLDTFQHTFIEKLATYALRRPMTFEDDEAIAAIAKAGRKADYRIRDILQHLVLSDLFQTR